jgi:hypothetical protein
MIPGVSIVGQTKVTDNSLVRLEGLKNLRNLTIPWRVFVGEEVEEFKRKLPKCRVGEGIII